MQRSPGTAQVWQDALEHKAQSPYMRHTLAGGTLRDFHFCPYEVRFRLLWAKLHTVNSAT